MDDFVKQPITDLEFDRSDWELVSFGDVAIQQKETVDRENTSLTRYVKGEHMGSEDLHLREWGELKDEYLGPAFIRKFEAGDILYGSRRTYLRKVAIAPFEGITSNTTFVIKANEKKIDKRLLPFVMLSEGFAQHSIRNSKGSVNPYVNWKDIANYEFLIPPKEKQNDLSNLLTAVDKIIQSDLQTLHSLKLLFESKIEESLHGISFKDKTIKQVLEKLAGKRKVSKLSEFGTIIKGKGIAKSEAQVKGIPCVRYGELYTRHHRLIRSYFTFISGDSAKKSLRLKKHDVLFAGSGEKITEIGKSAAFIEEEEVYAGSDILIFRPDDMDGTYLGYLMNSKLVRHQLNKMGTGATVMHIYASDLNNIQIPVCDRQEQEKIGIDLESMAYSISLMEQKIIASKVLQKRLINQVF
jgi:type I restriction enzyme S subunit